MQIDGERQTSLWQILVAANGQSPECLGFLCQHAGGAAGAHLYSGMLEMGLLLSVSSVDRNRPRCIMRMDFDKCRVEFRRQCQQATHEPQDEALDGSM
jgi:hypothetical protein